MTTDTLLRNLEEIQARALGELKASSSAEAVEQWRVTYMGRRSELTQVLRGLGPLDPEERRIVGAAANKVKALLEDRLAQAEEAIKGADLQAQAESGRIDVTLPGMPVPLGRLHPSTQILREICAAFESMGFQVVEGPEVEWDHYNFEMLNIPKDHPARDMWDTLWIDQVDEHGERPMLLRTHTSPMQIRTMENTRPPVRVLVPGKCYRYEATDATHESQFYQVEGLAVDEGITFADLKGTLYEFARLLFGAERKVRFRVDYFPFVEPGAEMAIDCFVCKGKGTGCRVCKGTGWIEIMGAGMVNPKVLEGVGYDSSKYTGFAFGMGPERIAMLKYGIEDVRLFYSNDLRFLGQF
jgi:phenylalanyl-tRNA synthetase alpha chain